MTSNLLERSKQVSAPQHQNLPSSQNLVVKSSQNSPILEPAVQKAAVKDPIAEQVEKGDLGPCHSPQLSPVNLDENFAAANEVGVGNHPNPESSSVSHSLVVKSCQHSPILEPADLRATVKDPIAKQVEKGDLGPLLEATSYHLANTRVLAEWQLVASNKSKIFPRSYIGLLTYSPHQPHRSRMHVRGLIGR